MIMEKMNEKKCKFCKRIIVGKSKLGICPDCLNKACNRAVGIGSAVVSIGGAILFKNGNFKKK
jgi:hydrogenase maturation factor